MTIQTFTEKVTSYEQQISQHTTEVEEFNRRLQEKETSGNSEELEKQRSEFQLKIEQLTAQIEESKKTQVSESETLKKQTFELESQVTQLNL